jgi:hypothetical protein
VEYKGGIVCSQRIGNRGFGKEFRQGLRFACRGSFPGNHVCLPSSARTEDLDARRDVGVITDHADFDGVPIPPVPGCCYEEPTKRSTACVNASACLGLTCSWPLPSWLPWRQWSCDRHSFSSKRVSHGEKGRMSCGEAWLLGEGFGLHFPMPQELGLSPGVQHRHLSVLCGVWRRLTAKHRVWGDQRTGTTMMVTRYYIVCKDYRAWGPRGPAMVLLGQARI